MVILLNTSSTDAQLLVDSRPGLPGSKDAAILWVNCLAVRIRHYGLPTIEI